MNIIVSLCVSFLVTTNVFGERSFVIDFGHDQFLKNGEPFRYISAGVHYFRVLQSGWDDRLYKIKKAGLNAIQTYVAWNMHEPQKGDYVFSGQADIERFLSLAQYHGLLVVLRPGPYICAEWEYGGFPYWIMKTCQKTIRSSDPVYMKLVDEWMSVLLNKMKPLLYENGGPIISVQVENEYGSYGCDHDYLHAMVNIYRKYLGDKVVLFTTDGDGDGYLKCGASDFAYTTVDFGPGGDVSGAFAIQRKYQKQGPFVNSEYYTGWLDHWGEKHHTTSASLVATYLDKMLAFNASVNMYMFEGGTNFGFMNGANQGGKYAAQPTSYDYDAPLTETGDPTEKYFAIQKVVSKYNQIPAGPQPKASDKFAYGKVFASTACSLFNLLEKVTPHNTTYPVTFETIDADYGYVLYRTALPQNFHTGDKITLTLEKFRDRAIILVDKTMQGVLDQNYNYTIDIDHGKVLDIIVENQGRVNYGPYLTETAKGIYGNVTLNNMYQLTKWQMYALGTKWSKQMAASLLSDSCNSVNEMYAEEIQAPLVTTFHFEIISAKDTFLKLDQWTKGFVLVNDFNIGRYWTPLGPQKTLYVPQSILIENNMNKVTLFEFDRAPSDSTTKRFIEFVDKPILG